MSGEEPTPKDNFLRPAPDGVTNDEDRQKQLEEDVQADLNKEIPNTEDKPKG